LRFFDDDAFIMAFRIAKGLLVLIVAILLVMVLAAAGPMLMGYKSFIVLSGSMEPTIPVGSVVVTKQERPNFLRSGDIITYVPPSEVVVTHRIVEVVSDAGGLGFRVKGDANRDPDPELIRPVNILGKVQYHVPIVGYIFQYVNQTTTRFVLMGLFVVLFGAQVQSYFLKSRASKVQAHQDQDNDPDRTVETKQEVDQTIDGHR